MSWNEFIAGGMIVGRLGTGLMVMFVLQRTGVLGFVMGLVFVTEGGACSFGGFVAGACIIGAYSGSRFMSDAGAFRATRADSSDMGQGGAADGCSPRSSAGGLESVINIDVVGATPCGRGGKGCIAGL